MRLALLLLAVLASPLGSAQSALPIVERVDLFTDADSATVRALVVSEIAETPYRLGATDVPTRVTVERFRVVGLSATATKVRVERHRDADRFPPGGAPFHVASRIGERLDEEQYEMMVGSQWTDPATDRAVCRQDPRTLIDPSFVRPSGNDSQPVDFQEEKQPLLIGGMQGLAERVVYPEAERRAGIEGRVFTQFVVSPRGEVECVAVLSAPTDGMARASMDAVRGVRFVPGAQRGRTVRVRFTLPVNFELN